jgi:hypothetical protein
MTENTALSSAPVEPKLAGVGEQATQSLLEEVIAAHGGRRRWQQLAALRAQVRCGGWALAARGQARAFADCEVVAATLQPWLVVEPFKGGRGGFRADQVWLERQGQVRRQREQPRAAFGQLRRMFFWDSLDALYFGGYALWNYLCTPFLLLQPGMQVRELPGWVEGNERWRRLAVRFPADYPTHCAEQIFYIDGRGYIRRHDYVAEVFGRYAAAAHYCERHRDFGGLILPTRRRVYPRLPSGKPLRALTLIRIDIDAVEALELSPDSD